MANWDYGSPLQLSRVASRHIFRAPAIRISTCSNDFIDLPVLLAKLVSSNLFWLVEKIFLAAKFMPCLNLAVLIEIIVIEFRSTVLPLLVVWISSANSIRPLVVYQFRHRSLKFREIFLDFLIIINDFKSDFHLMISFQLRNSQLVHCYFLRSLSYGFLYYLGPYFYNKHL